MIDTNDIDRRLKALFAEPPTQADRVFAERVIALAAYESKLEQARRRGRVRLAAEAAALTAVLATFALIASLPSPSKAGFGDNVALTSPAMLGLALLALWALVATRGPATA